jgi:HK97 gp10 family phage protein
MTAITVKITGDKELVRKLRRLGDDTGGRLLEAAVVSGALLVQNEAKRKSPLKTGNLRRSIHIGGHSERSELGQSDGSDVGGNVASATRAHVLVGTDVIYGAAQEFGTSTIPAHPYLRPALDEQKDAVRVEIGEALKDLILKATR